MQMKLSFWIVQTSTIESDSFVNMKTGFYSHHFFIDFFIYLFLTVFLPSYRWKFPFPCVLICIKNVWLQRLVQTENSMPGGPRVEGVPPLLLYMGVLQVLTQVCIF